MPVLYDVYCDESCHLEHDGQSAMVLGAVWCPHDRTREITQRLRQIKERHGVSPMREIKWTKVSPARLALYCDILDYFFDDDDLHFRAVVIPDKALLDHAAYCQSHDDWYYKVYFYLLKVILDPDAAYQVYLDIKDTRGGHKVRRLHEVLANSVYDFSRRIVRRIQQVRSHEVQILQVADILIGAIGYANRGLESSEAKLALVDLVRRRSGYSLTRTTLYREEKVNLLIWRDSRGA